MSAEVILGDCLEVMRTLEAESVDAIVCDPPYGLEFMGKAWDRIGDIGQAKNRGMSDGSFKGMRLPESYNADANVKCAVCGRWRKDHKGRRCDCAAPQFANVKASQGRTMQEWHYNWATEALRVAKPGAHLLAFSGTRTWHRLACAIEDAGWEIRDTIASLDGSPSALLWIHGQGFPKSKNLGDGRGSAMKPAFEPVLMARKPLTGTLEATVSRYGTGAINIDACRIAGEPISTIRGTALGVMSDDKWDNQKMRGQTFTSHAAGRWPANCILSHVGGPGGCREVGTRKVKGGTAVGGKGKASSIYGTPLDRMGGEDQSYADADGTETVSAWICHESCPIKLLDEQSGELTSGANPTRRGSPKFRNAYGEFEGQEQCEPARGIDRGGASRFFLNVTADRGDELRFRYCAKASRAERERGLEGMPRIANDFQRETSGLNQDRPNREGRAPGVPSMNHHPTVKPLALMRWLCRLITPPMTPDGKPGLILDPFAGSGSTLCAGVLEGFSVLGIEAEPEYVAIAERRLAYWSRVARRYQRFRQYLIEHPRESAPRAPVDPDQGSLFGAHPETEGPP